MSTFISLLSEHHDAFMAAYQKQLSNDMVQAVNAMRRCQTEAMGTSQWYCEHCEYHDSVPLSCVWPSLLPAVPAPQHGGVAGAPAKQTTPRGTLYGDVHLTG